MNMERRTGDNTSTSINASYLKARWWWLSASFMFLLGSLMFLLSSLMLLKTVIFWKEISLGLNGFGSNNVLISYDGTSHKNEMIYDHGSMIRQTERYLRKPFPLDILEGDDDDAVPAATSPVSPTQPNLLHLSQEQLLNASSALGCICAAALAAGLTMGLMSIDPLFLAIKSRSGTNEEKEQASKILPLVKQHHRLLVTLLLLNSLANEALPIFLEPLVSPFVAVLLSVTFVLFFGEIIPSAIFTGPDQMKIAAKLIPLVKAVMFIFTPLALPIATVLDHFFGSRRRQR